MASYSRASEHKLRTVHPKLQNTMRVVVRTYDNTILEGHRGQEAQHQAFVTGKSKLDFPNGNHNAYPSEAVDSTPYPIDFADGALVKDGKLDRAKLVALLRLYHYGGFVQGVGEALGDPLRWGGDWDSDRDFSDQKFNDLVHFERVNK